ncbi:MerR family transcriptional regulator, heat shock protein HspR [Actinomyces ruminicola]|uniref:MerR family transcriptional regulator, heat shock protein HspR n=1 Tax=Actinomyces ruminicola TaxID=332524 RepID=A0A1H0AVG8_9ACTO|nr:helix-turn-helix transcriptional regulator [Actinomyces ruminicola]SDN37460.1 MerR family transcriptional regulator, heat shock protein HspR [Actinomyces ruminicola]
MTTRRLTGQGVDFLAEDADERAVYVISVAAELAGMHPQTLRQYDRLGLVTPARASGRGRRYSHRDVERLRRVQALSQEGINLEGIRRILDLERRLERLEEENRSLRARQAAVERVFAAAADGEVQVVPVAPGRRARTRPDAQAAAGNGAVGGSSGRPGTAIVVRRSW